MTVHAARNTYDPARPFGPWLVALANRRIVDGLRRSGRVRSRESPLDDEYETFSEHGANYHESRAVGRAVQVAIDELPKGQRDAIRMLKIEEMSLQEASRSSGLSIAALKVASHRAMKNLRKIFERSDNAA
jgi:RNA polymerase sigma factor (sigma-70 family)